MGSVKDPKLEMTPSSSHLVYARGRHPVVGGRQVQPRCHLFQVLLHRERHGLEGQEGEACGVEVQRRQHPARGRAMGNLLHAYAGPPFPSPHL